MIWWSLGAPIIGMYNSQSMFVLRSVCSSLFLSVCWIWGEWSNKKKTLAMRCLSSMWEHVTPTSEGRVLHACTRWMRRQRENRTDVANNETLRCYKHGIIPVNKNTYAHAHEHKLKTQSPAIVWANVMRIGNKVYKYWRIGYSPNFAANKVAYAEVKAPRILEGLRECRGLRRGLEEEAEHTEDTSWAPLLGQSLLSNTDIWEA